ncbi:MAG: hypothetical protein HC848_10995 [Limnobacter sp.]|nr:hypothetical protein [Limnobacter sp.]
MINTANNARLSHRVLWGLTFLYIVPGLFSRSPWKPDDAIGFGLSWHFAQAPFSQWSFGQIGDRVFAQEGLLSAWLGGLLGKLGLLLDIPPDWLDDFMRLGNVFWLALTAWAVWQTTFWLAKRAELQPENPLGNAPTRTEYARTVADSSVLCLLGTLGLLVRSHFQVAELAELSGIAVMLYAAVRALDKPIGAGWYLGTGIVLAFFARGFAHWLPFLALLLFSACIHPALRFGLFKRLLRAALVVAIAFFPWFFWLQHSPESQEWWNSWLRWNLDRYLLLDANTNLSTHLVTTTIKTLAWFLWPVLPLSGWTLWRYRHALVEAGLRIPTAATAAGLLVLFSPTPPKKPTTCHLFRACACCRRWGFLPCGVAWWA